MQKIKEKYFKIFQLEGSQGYENRAVMGGLQALGKSWPSEAREQGVSESLIPVISMFFNRYPDLEPENRRNVLLEIGDLLSIPNLKTLPEYIETEKPVIPEPKQVKPAPQVTKANQISKVQATQPDEQVVRSKVNTRLREIARQPMSDESHGLEAPVSVIRGVGDKQGAHLVKLGVHKIKDLLYLFPRRYDDYSKLKTINQLEYGEEVTILARVVSIDAFQTKKGKRLVEAVVSDTTGALRLLWMNQDWHVRYLKKDLFISVSGKIDTYLGRPVIWYPDYEPIDKQQLHTNRIVPVYPLTAKITQRWLRRTQFNTVRYWAPKVNDFLPDQLREEAQLLKTNDALLQVHFPENNEALKAAQRRFAFDELFLLQVGVLQQKQQWQQLVGHPYEVTDAWVTERVASLPLSLQAHKKDPWMKFERI
jgi:ATP-dependent DNA helicase RecG